MEHEEKNSSQTYLLALSIVFATILLSGALLYSSNNLSGALARIGGATSGSTGTVITGSNPTATPDANAPTLPQSFEAIAGAQSCGTPGTPNVIILGDTYCPACTSAEPKVKEFLDKFGSKVQISYAFIETHSAGLVSSGHGTQAQIDTAFKYNICAVEQGLDKFGPMESTWYSSLKVDSATNDYKPYTEAEIRKMFTDAGLDMAKIDACLPTALAKNDVKVKNALSYAGSQVYTPMTIINCKYAGNTYFAADALCAIDSKTPGCA